jgi:hypothetical protein
VHEVRGPVPWLAADDLAEQRDPLTESRYAQLQLNRWTESEDRPASADDLRACVAVDGGWRRSRVCGTRPASTLG